MEIRALHCPLARREAPSKERSTKDEGRREEEEGKAGKGNGEDRSEIGDRGIDCLHSGVQSTISQTLRI
eukprot:scaffold23144_cov39-Tisochrysis_lutea.AAC.1